MHSACTLHSVQVAGEKRHFSPCAWAASVTPCVTPCVRSQLTGRRWQLQGYDESAIRIFCNYPNFIDAASVAPFMPVDDPNEADVLFSPQPINAFMSIPE